MIALTYKDAVSIETLRERYDIPRSTVYYWLGRFDKKSIEEAVRDDKRLGRPPNLTAEERVELRDDLPRSPQAFGFAASTWSTKTVRAHLEEKYDVEYSLGHVRRLLRTLAVDS